MWPPFRWSSRGNRQRCVDKGKAGGRVGGGRGGESAVWTRRVRWVARRHFLPSAAIVASPRPGGSVRRPQRRRKDWDGGSTPWREGAEGGGRAAAAAQAVWEGVRGRARPCAAAHTPALAARGSSRSADVARDAPPPLRPLPLPRPLCTGERQARPPRPNAPRTTTTPPASPQRTISLTTILVRSSRPRPTPFLRPLFLLFLFLSGLITATPSAHNAVASIRVGV